MIAKITITANDNARSDIWDDIDDFLLSLSPFDRRDVAGLIHNLTEAARCGNERSARSYMWFARFTITTRQLEIERNISRIKLVEQPCE